METKKRPKRLCDAFDLKSMLLEKQLTSCRKEIGNSCKIFPIVFQFDDSYPVNTLRKSNVILWLYFSNLRKLLFLLTLMVRNLNYVRNSDVAITLAKLT